LLASFRSADQITDCLYKNRVNAIDEMTDLPRSLRTRVMERFSLGKIDLVRVLGARDTTRKFLFRLLDGNLIESVLIPASPASRDCGKWKIGPPDNLRLDPGRLRLRLQILCERFGRVHAQSASERNCESNHRDRAGKRRKDRQRRFHGDGRTACEFRERAARDSDY
jgi:hypothetical protein